MSRWVYRTPGKRDEAPPPARPPWRKSSKLRTLAGVVLVLALCVGHLLIALGHHGVANDYLTFWGVVDALFGSIGPIVLLVWGDGEADAEKKRGER